MIRWLLRSFGYGRLPAAMRPILEQEGIVLLEEYAGGTITFRKFRAPGRRYSWRKTTIVAAIVVTELRVAMFVGKNPIMNLGRKREELAKLRVEPWADGLIVRFEAGDFDERQSGEVEIRVSTERASQIARYLWPPR